MNNIFDTHAHYNDSAFDNDRETLLASHPGAGICALINCGTDIPSSRLSLALAEKYSYIYAACGVHPEEVEKAYDGYLADLRVLLAHKKCAAVGEIGLDYHYTADNKELQKQIFREQIMLANELSLPVIVHDREAHGDTLEILKELRPQGVLHCFSGSRETMREVVSLGMYIGLGGAVTFKNAKKPLEVAAAVPEDRLLVETDCPYMAPVPYRGKRNDSTLIPYAAEVIANARGTAAEHILEVTKANAQRLFGLPDP